MTIHARNSRRASSRIPNAPSPIEEGFALQIRVAKLPRPQRDMRLHPTRKWRFDFVWVDMLLVVEIEGEVHRISERFHADIEKYAWLTLRGFTLLRVGGREVRSGRGLEWLQSLLWERAGLGIMGRQIDGDTHGPAPRVPNFSKPSRSAWRDKSVDKSGVSSHNRASNGPHALNTLIINEESALSDLT